MPDRRLSQIRKKVEVGERLSAADGEFLYHPEVDLHDVGELADLVRHRKNGDRVFYNLNAHLNPTNVCMYRCTLCAYSRDPDDPRAFVLSMDDMLRAGQEAVDAGCTELHIVSGVHPDKSLEWYLGILRTLHAAFPRLHLKACTAVEIAWFAESTKRNVRTTIEDLIRAGLGSLPGGGAEIFAPEIRTEICPRKADGRTWLGVHRAAHQLGLRTNASMLFGHLEHPEHRIDHLVELRLQQDVTGGFQAFVPLVFHPANTRMAHIEPASADLILRTVAVSRLMLDNFDHVKAYWVSLGVGLAQTALSYGADDLDGTVRREKLHRAAGSKAPEILTEPEIRRLITEAGRQPQERDSLYRPVKRQGTQWSLA
ncbi:MAG: aminofutalosine synthase MqnE [Thermoguttaceae bacterium]|jgi:aminodeoxyfutalosine synthase|nr:aminofutalosine synthase MqnE [Thermoguttaceae bacterium]